jgi:hypothetical protein
MMPDENWLVFARTKTTFIVIVDCSRQRFRIWNVSSLSDA